MDRSCPDCRGVMQLGRSGTYVCKDCGGSWNEAPGAFTFHQDTALPPKTCPRCQSTTLVTGTAHAIRRFRCTTCSGMYYPKAATTSLHLEHDLQRDLLVETTVDLVIRKLGEWFDGDNDADDGFDVD